MYRRRQKYPDKPPIIKIKLILKDCNIMIEPSWDSIKLYLKDVVRNAQKASETLTRWGFHHMQVSKK